MQVRCWLPWPQFRFEVEAQLTFESAHRTALEVRRQAQAIRVGLRSIELTIEEIVWMELDDAHDCIPSASSRPGLASILRFKDSLASRKRLRTVFTGTALA